MGPVLQLASMDRTGEIRAQLICAEPGRSGEVAAGRGPAAVSGPTARLTASQTLVLRAGRNWNLVEPKTAPKEKTCKQLHFEGSKVGYWV